MMMTTPKFISTAQTCLVRVRPIYSYIQLPVGHYLGVFMVSQNQNDEKKFIFHHLSPRSSSFSSVLFFFPHKYPTLHFFLSRNLRFILDSFLSPELQSVVTSWQLSFPNNPSNYFFSPFPPYLHLDYLATFQVGPVSHRLVPHLSLFLSIAQGSYRNNNQIMSLELGRGAVQLLRAISKGVTGP